MKTETLSNVVPMEGRSSPYRRTLLPLRQRARGVSRPIVYKDVIDTPARIRELVDALARNGYRSYLRGEGFTREAQLVSLSQDVLTWRVEAALPVAPVVAEISSYNSIYEMKLEALQAVQGDVYTSAIPSEITQLRHRKLRRVVAPSGMTVTYSFPGRPTKRMTREVRDFCAEGLCFVAEAGDMLSPGTRVKTEISCPGYEPFFVNLEIRQSGFDEDGPSHGTQIRFEDEASTLRWRMLTLEVAHPQVHRGARYAKDMWALYHRAGYFGLSDKVPEQFTKLQAPFEDVVKKLEAAPELGCHVARQTHDGATDCTMAILRTYASSCLIFQLAKVSGSSSDGSTSREILRDVTETVFEHAQTFDPQMRWLTALVQVKKVWSRSAYYDFPKRLESNTEKVCIVRNHVYEVPNQGWSPAPLDGVEISEATAAEINVLVSHLETTRTPAYRESQDLTRWTLDLGAIRGAWNRAGLRRERHLLAARQGGKVVALAVLESADEGMHLFRLLDNVRLFGVAEGGEQTFPALIGAAQAWFGARSRDAFTCFIELDRPTPTPEALEGLVDMGQADFIALSSEYLTENLEHVHEITAPPPMSHRA